MRKELMQQLKSYKTGLTNPLKKAFEINKGAKLFATASFLLLLLTLVFIGKPIAQMVKQKNLSLNQETLAVNQENLSVNQEVQAVNQESLAVNKEALAVNKEVLAVNQEALAVNQESLAVNKEALAVNKEVLAVNQEAPAINKESLAANQAVQTANKDLQTTHKAAQSVHKDLQTTHKAAQSVHKDIQSLFAKQLKATFKQTTSTNLEPAPINHWYQTEVNNQVVYFSPTQALIFLGEVYNKSGISLSAQTLRKWQSRRVANLDVSTALVIGTGAIEIIEFMDTDCTFCQHFNHWISTINKAYKDKYNQDLVTRKIVLTPIDQFHPEAHKEAVHILCQSPDNYETALKQTLEEKLSFAEMETCKKGKALLIEHRKIAQALGVSATPTLVINGQVIQGFNQQKLGAVIKQQLNKINRIEANKKQNRTHE